MFRSLRALSICLVYLFLLNNTAYADKFPTGYPECWKDAKNPVDTNYATMDLTKKNLGQPLNLFCPINSKVGHKFFLVDFTSPLKKAQVDWISQRIFKDALFKDTPPYHKVSYMVIDGKAPQSQEIAYSQCRFKTGNKSKFVGEETNDGCEGNKQISENFAAWLSLNTEFENVLLGKNYPVAERSLLFEYLFHVLRESVTDFTSEYPERELVIVSDLMQHSKRFSFYSHCKTDGATRPNKCPPFESLIKKTKVKNYIDDRKPKSETLKNLKVTVLYINHAYETRMGLSSSLVGLWEDLFKYIGIENYQIVKQLDIP
jgi:hypothetical protein